MGNKYLRSNKNRDDRYKFLKLNVGDLVLIKDITTDSYLRGVVLWTDPSDGRFFCHSIDTDFDRQRLRGWKRYDHSVGEGFFYEATNHHVRSKYLVTKLNRYQEDSHDITIINYIINTQKNTSKSIEYSSGYDTGYSSQTGSARVNCIKVIKYSDKIYPESSFTASLSYVSPDEEVGSWIRGTSKYDEKICILKMTKLKIDKKIQEVTKSLLEDSYEPKF